MIGLILAAAGAGTRFGSETPKQFAEMEGSPLYMHSVQSFRPFCSQLVVVVPADWKKEIERQVRRFAPAHRPLVEVGGEWRQDSVEKGLARLGDDIEIVLVHDAARPFCSPTLIERVIQGVREHEACIPVIPIADTVKQLEGDVVKATLDRSRLAAAQTPQGFRLPLLIRAIREAKLHNRQATDESALVEALGCPVHVVDGEAANVKITWKEDL